MQLCTWACAGVSVLSEADVAIITVCVCVCTFWYECPLVVLACESLHVCTVCIWRCEHARFCVSFHVLYINFHYSFILLSMWWGLQWTLFTINSINRL